MLTFSDQVINSRLLTTNTLIAKYIVIKQREYLKYFLVLIVLLLIAVPNASGLDKPKNIRTVVIDAGHGGRDPGAIGKKAREKDIALSIALKLGNYIQNRINDIKVIYTRKTDVFISLEKRAEIANSNNADIFISVHVNANTSSKPYGTSTYVMGVNDSKRNMDVAIRENSVMKLEEDYSATYEGFEPNDPESYIMFSLLQYSNQNQSLELASLIQDQFRTRAGRRDLGVMQQPIYVLWKTTMPSVFVETGFISNPKEESFLITNQGQDYIASAIFRAFRSYINSINSKSVDLGELKSNAVPTTVSKEEPINNIYFSVQVMSSLQKVPISSKQLKGQNGIIELIIDNAYKYMVGKTNNYNEITILQNTLLDKFPGAFIIAIENGKKISVKEARKKLNIE